LVSQWAIYWGHASSDRITWAVLALVASIDEFREAWCALRHTRTRATVGTAPFRCQWNLSFRYDGETITRWLRHASCPHPDRCRPSPAAAWCARFPGKGVVVAGERPGFAVPQEDPADLMRDFLALFLRCALAFGLAFVPVANAVNMAAMDAGREDRPPCHAPVQKHQDGKCSHAASQCHCAMSACLPAELTSATPTPPPSDHPQTARRLALGLTSLPETPPPR
jgi:hypothetical protein